MGARYFYRCWPLSVIALLTGACFPDPPECGPSHACVPSDDPCVEMACVANECVERALDACGADAETSETSDVIGDSVEAETLDAANDSQPPTEIEDTDVAQRDADVEHRDGDEDSTAETVEPLCPGFGEGCEAEGECGRGVVECAEGTPRCSTGPSGSASQASAELCDELDNDCDGDTDEDFGVGGAIALVGAVFEGDDGKVKDDPCGVGICANGRVVCSSGKTSLICDTDRLAEPSDSCDDRDEDCNGIIDDAFTSDGSPDAVLRVAAFASDKGKSKGAECGTGACVSDGAGIVGCAADGTTLECSSDGRADVELCDALDNDCDGETDESFVAGGDAPLAGANDLRDDGKVKGDLCGSGACAGGQVACTVDGRGLECSNDALGASEVCDEADNDCDGETDEGFEYNGLGLGEPCDGVGACGPGLVECGGIEATATCSTNVDGTERESVAEVCDDADNDCDGFTDNGFAYLGVGLGGVCNGVGECGVGVVECGSASSATCSTNPNGSGSQATGEVCDSEDDDCDGVIDDNCEAVCSPVCQHGGDCVVGNDCDCNGTGYSGDLCEIPVCSPSCMNGGACSAPGTCSCSGTGHSGSRCETPVCTLSCLNGGTCSAPDTCSCSGTGYTGTRCQTPACTLPCLNGGSCSAPDTCSCSGTGFTGSRCETPVCAPVCQHGGSCAAPNTCSCGGTGYTGSRCETAVCDPTCLNGGVCSAPNTCGCSSSYSGPRCETPVCTQACENGGICSAPNTCSCSGGYSGPTCALLTSYTKIAAGTFSMGSPSNEVGRFLDEIQHSVTLSRAFWVKTTEVTRSDWQALMGNAPSSTAGCSQCPVDNVDWFDAIAYANALSTLHGAPPCYNLSGCTGTPGVATYQCASVTFAGLTCSGYRLPTEAEWEYAARAGTTTATYNGNITETGSNLDPVLDSIAWYVATSGNAPHTVAIKAPNAWGLYDMLGNVLEWLHDQTGSYGAGAVTDPTGLGGFGNRFRGGAWASTGRYVRAAARLDADPATTRGPGVGFRLVRTAP